MSYNGDTLQNADVIKAKQASNSQGSLCWRCKNVFFGKCKKPVNGWNAIRNDIRYPIRLLDVETQQFKTVIAGCESYFVFECPNFIPDD